EGGMLVVHARDIAIETGRVSRDIIERGPAADLFGIFDRIARQITPSRNAAAGDRRFPPLAVFENYIKGLLAETPSTAVNYLNAALTAQPSFDRARLALWEIYADQGDHTRALTAVTPVAEDSEWWRRAKFQAGLSFLSLRKYDDAYATFTAIADTTSSAP